MRSVLLFCLSVSMLVTAVRATDQGPRDSTSPGSLPAVIEPGHPENSPAIPGPTPSDVVIPVMSPKAARKGGPGSKISSAQLQTEIDSVQKQLQDFSLSPEKREALRQQLTDLQVKQMSDPTKKTKADSPMPAIAR